MHKATSRDLPIEQKSLREYMSRKVKEGEAEIWHLGRNNLWMAYFSRSKNAKTYMAEKHLAGHPAASGQLSTRPTRATSRSSSLLVRCMTCPRIRPRATDTLLMLGTRPPLHFIGFSIHNELTSGYIHRSYGYRGAKFAQAHRLWV